MDAYYAHISEDRKRRQTIDAHLKGTAELAQAFASAFDAGEYGYYVGLAHDIGKYSKEFQQRLFGGPRVDHSSAGMLECARDNQMFAAICVAGHHGGLPDYGNQITDLPGDSTFIGRIKKAADGKIPSYENWHNKLPSILSHFDIKNDIFYGSMWIRMLFSALVDADFIDTERFMKENVFRGKYASLELLQKKLDHFVEAWNVPESDMNALRNEVREDCNIAAESDPGMFSLTVPTGGGKTISSLSFALHHAVRNHMARVIYVIPYTSIIEQNAAVFRSILDAENVLEHHSEAFLNDSEDLSEQERRLSLATENWDAPIIVTTAVQFFDSLFSNRASKCRKLHNIANSVIIFDEAQMLPMEHLLPCVAAIGTLVEHFHCTAVLCTATQPYISDLLLQYAPDYYVREICRDTNALFAKLKRTKYVNIGKHTAFEIAECVSDRSQTLCIVNTRRSAQEIFELLPTEGRYHLSTLMYPMHRDRVLKEIRQRLKEGKTCRVVSTSLIEAGVDVDFPAVFRELSGLDSIVQAGGRCNREGKRDADDSVVSIFELDRPIPPMIRMNAGATGEALCSVPEIGSPKSITAYFSALRSLRSSGIDVMDTVKHIEKGISGCALPFRTVAEKFRMISDDTKTVYILGDDQGPLLEKMKTGFADRNDYRLAGRYAVNIYEKHFTALVQTGDIVEFAPGSAYLENCSLYNSDTGLSLAADAEKALFA